MTKRLRIVFATHSVFAGGAELALLDLVRLLVDEGHVVLVLSPVEGPLIQRMEGAGAQVVVTPLRWWASVRPRAVWERALTPAALTAGTRALQRIVADFRPDVAVTNTIATPALALSAKLLRVPHMWLLHEYALAEQGLFLDLPRSMTYRIAGVLSRTILAASYGLAREVSTLSRHSCGVLYASVPLPRYALPRAAALRPPYQLLSLGHVTEAKRQDELVRSLALARATGLDCRLVLVGRREPTFEIGLRRLVEELHLQDQVSFEDETADPGRWLATSHALVSASRHEVCPRVVVEAMKASLPVVACDRAGNAELLADGRGWLYSPGEETDLVRGIAWAVEAAGPSKAEEWAHHNFSDQNYLSTFLSYAHQAAA